MILAFAACSPTPPPAEPTSIPPAPLGKSPGGFALWNIDSPSAGPTGVRVMLLGNDGKPLSLTAPDAGAEGWPVWSPDGWRLATLVASPRGTSNALHLVDTSAGTRRVLLDNGRFHAMTRWSPSGRFISVRSEGPRASAKSAGDVRLDRVDVASGKATTLAPSVFAEAWVGANALRIVVLAADGTKHELWVAVGATTTRVTRLDEFDETRELDPSHITWSPDSTKLATLSLVGDLHLALLIADNDGANVHELTRIQGVAGGLAWRP